MDEVGVEVGVKGVAILDASMTNKGSDGVATQTKDEDLRFFKSEQKAFVWQCPNGAVERIRSPFRLLPSERATFLVVLISSRNSSPCASSRTLGLPFCLLLLAR
jgi:hypothetical protein